MADASPEKPDNFSSQTYESRLEIIKEKIESNRMFIESDSGWDDKSAKVSLGGDFGEVGDITDLGESL